MGTDEIEVTAAVTEPRKLEPWEIAGLTKEMRDALEIPAFLRRGDPACTVGQSQPSARSPARPMPPPPTPATAAAAAVSGGSSSGSKPNNNPGVTGTFDFNQYRVDPAEIETKIKSEADRRWRNWMPTKEDRKRPRRSWYERQVRKEFYP